MQDFVSQNTMAKSSENAVVPNAMLLQSEQLYKYILDTTVYPREPEALKELRDATAVHPNAFFGTTPDVGQLMAMLLKLLNAKKTIEIGVFTGYSVLLTALNIPSDGKITAIDIDRESYELGLPMIEKAGVEHKIDFHHSRALPVLDKLLENQGEGTFDFAFVDADKDNYLNYHERLMKLVKADGMIIYDNALWGGTVAWNIDAVPEAKRYYRNSLVNFNKALAADHRLELSLVPLGDGISICRRLT